MTRVGRTVINPGSSRGNFDVEDNDAAIQARQSSIEIKQTTVVVWIDIRCYIRYSKAGYVRSWPPIFFSAIIVFCTGEKVAALL